MSEKEEKKEKEPRNTATLYICTVPRAATTSHVFVPAVVYFITLTGEINHFSFASCLNKVFTTSTYFRGASGYEPEQLVVAAQSEGTKGGVVRSQVFLSSIFDLEKERTGGNPKVLGGCCMELSFPKQHLSTWRRSTRVGRRSGGPPKTSPS